MARHLVVTAVVAAALGAAGCTVHQTEVPSLTGPSTLGLSLSLSATPDSISQDGASQSSVRVTAHDAAGRVIQGLPIHLDMAVNGTVQDYGTLSARNVVTGSDGIATAVFTAPPPPPAAAGGGVNTVSIRAVPSGSNSTASLASEEVVNIRLVPPGVILPPAGTPTVSFTITPSPVNLNVPSIFDASASTPGSGASSIVSYVWAFGDGGAATAQVVSHTYTTTGTFSVTLTVTNDRGVAASTTQQVSVGTTPAPTASFVATTTAPAISETVFFNGEASRAAPGHQIVRWNWDFGDGTVVGDAFRTSHVYTVAAIYTVILTITDDTGQQATASVSVQVGTGAPLATFTFSQGSAVTHTVNFDASASVPHGNATITDYSWNFGDGTTLSSGTTPTTSHAYSSTAARTVTLTVTDSLGRRGVFSASVTPP